MGKKIKKAFTFGRFILLVLVSGVGFFLIMWVSGNIPDQDRIQPGTAKVNAVANIDRKKNDLLLVLESETLKEKFEHMGVSFENQLVRELQKYYRAIISKKSTQASIYEMRNSLFGSNPDGRLFFYKILKRAFPDYADEIMLTLDKLDLYHQWLEENESIFSQMTEESRLAFLWEKRIALFGEDAHEIWVDEMLATDSRKVKMKDALESINEFNEIAIEEKLELYQNALRETYEGSPEEYFLGLKPTLSKIFFSIDSVQDELKQMSPDQRQMAINEIRRDMGFVEPQIEKMEEKDAEYNQRWEIGLKYMEERTSVVQNFEGPEQKNQLKVLRKKYFKDEAKTIELEEENDDFFRFERSRFYGRN